MSVEKMKVEVIVRETIKPSSPTPPHLRSYKLCIMDQFNPSIYLALVLFYATSGGGGTAVGGWRSIISQRLKESLSEVLTRFYPVAGRLRDHLYVDCNDEGADYLEAQVNCPLSDVLERPRMEAMKHFLPTEPKEMGKAPLLLAQSSFFTCGGMALGVKISHKLADVMTFSTVIKGWTSTARGNPNEVVPDFSAASLFPPLDPFPNSAIATQPVNEENGIARRFVFQGSKIDALKAKAASVDVERPTRVEVVSALLWKCAESASRRSGLGCQRPRASALFGAVNARASLVPPLPPYSFGNVLGLLRAMTNESEMDLQGTVCRLRKAISEGREQSQRVMKNPMSVGGMLLLKPDEVKMYRYSCWCRMHIYEADFGWGKPTWASIGSLMGNNFMLMDGREGDGIEAWVNLSEEEMALMECDEELLESVSLNPNGLH